MKYTNLITGLCFLLLSACSHHVAPPDVDRTPQSLSGADCKKITDYDDIHAKNYLKMFPQVQKAQLKVLGTYSYKLKLQIAKLMSGISHENISHSNPTSVKLYKSYLKELVAKSAYVSALYHQLKAANVYEMCRAFAYGEIVLDEDSFQDVIERAQILGKEKGLLIEMKDEWVKNLGKDIVKVLLKEVAYEIHDAVIQNIAWSGINAIARQSAGGIVRGVLVSATTGTLISVLTKPLKSGTIPEYSKWRSAIHTTPELYLNPEWMKKAGISTIDPWTTHSMALERNKESMKKLASKLYASMDNDFSNRISHIYLSTKNAESEALKQQFHVEPAESTRVNVIQRPEDRFPFWMK